MGTRRTPPRLAQGACPHLPLAAVGPAEQEGGIRAVLQHPQSTAILEAQVPRAVL